MQKIHRRWIGYRPPVPGMGKKKMGDPDISNLPEKLAGVCLVGAQFDHGLQRRGEKVGDRQVISATWIDDCRDGGDPEVWQRSISVEKFPAGSYRNKWYQTGHDHRAFCAIGIHSQWIYIDPITEVVIVKLSCQPDPLNIHLGPANLRAFEAICESF